MDAATNHPSLDRTEAQASRSGGRRPQPARRHARRLAGTLALAIGVAPFLGMAAASAAPATATGAYAPSDPMACSGPHWSSVVTLDPDGTVHSDVWISDDHPSLTVLFDVPAGEWRIAEVITWAGHPDRNTYPHEFEAVRIAFVKDGLTVATTAATPDLADGTTSAEFVGPLGSVRLPNGADSIVWQHAATWGPTSSLNVVKTVAVCLEAVPVVTTTTAAPTTTVPPTTTAPPSTTVPPTTVASTVPPTTETPVEVEGVNEVRTQDEDILAYTGVLTWIEVGVGISLLGLGAWMVRKSKTRLAA